MTSFHTCLLISTTLLLVLVPSTEQVSTECCQPNSKWVTKRNCSDGSSVRLNCSFYIADPEMDPMDSFIVDHDGSILIFLHGGTPVTRENFCTITDNNTKKKTALICFGDDVLESNDWRFWVLGCVSIVSSCFLILTLIIYGCLPELRDIQDKSMICVMTSLTIGYLMIAFVNFRPPVLGFDYFCITIAFILYYSFLTTFFWLNIVSFNIWRSVWFQSFGVKDDTLFSIFCLIGWGFPTCFLIAALTTQHVDGSHLKPRFGERNCWFAGDKEIWVYFYGPMAILLLLNVMYLSMTSWRLWRVYKDNNGCKMRNLRLKCLLYIKLVLVMGITWIFEVVSSLEGWRNDILWIPTDLLNGLQGLIIFILLVVNRKKVRILLAKRKPCGIPFPKPWAAQVDEESDDVFPEEVELSRSI